METFKKVLGIAYYNQGFFNIGVNQSDLLGGHNEDIKVHLGNDKIINARIDRTTNGNGTPRIMCGVDYRNWVQKNFKQGDQMTVKIISKHELKLSK